jgi:hypothetical protein
VVLYALSFLYSTSSPVGNWLFGNSCATGTRGGSVCDVGAAAFFFFGFLFFFFLAAEEYQFIQDAGA